jgi:hypothetical protein
MTTEVVVVMKIMTVTNDNRGGDDDEANDGDELPLPPKSPGISRPRNHC